MLIIFRPGTAIEFYLVYVAPFLLCHWGSVLEYCLTAPIRLHSMQKSSAYKKKAVPAEEREEFPIYHFPEKDEQDDDDDALPPGLQPDPREDITANEIPDYLEDGDDEDEADGDDAAQEGQEAEEVSDDPRTEAGMWFVQGAFFAFLFIYLFF